MYVQNNRHGIIIISWKRHWPKTVYSQSFLKEF